MKLPNFFIVGAAKAGTTSLYQYLKLHPEVYMSPIKEPNYFCSDIKLSDFDPNIKRRLIQDLESYFKKETFDEMHLAHISNWEHYRKLFDNAADQKAIGEASASYLYSKTAPFAIKEKIPHAKIIMVLRNPVERAYSHYLMDLRDGYTYLPFRQALEKDISSIRKGWGISHLYIELGLYYEQVKRYLQNFERQNIKIYLFEDFKATNQLIADLFDFLGVNNTFAPDIAFIHNKARIPNHRRTNFILKNSFLRKLKFLLPDGAVNQIKTSLLNSSEKPILRDQEREYVKSFYREDVNKLSELLNKDLSTWLV